MSRDDKFKAIERSRLTRQTKAKAETRSANLSDAISRYKPSWYKRKAISNGAPTEICRKNNPKLFVPIPEGDH